MIVEHWVDDVSNTLLAPEAVAGHPWVGLPRLCCRIEAEDHDAALSQYHVHMGWEPYKPMSDAPHEGWKKV